MVVAGRRERLCQSGVWAEGDERNILEKGGASMEVLDLKETSDKKDRSAWQVRTEGDEVEEATAEGGEKLIHAK